MAIIGIKLVNRCPEIDCDRTYQVNKDQVKDVLPYIMMTLPSLRRSRKRGCDLEITTERLVSICTFAGIYQRMGYQVDISLTSDGSYYIVRVMKTFKIRHKRSSLEMIKKAGEVSELVVI